MVVTFQAAAPRTGEVAPRERSPHFQASDIALSSRGTLIDADGEHHGCRLTADFTNRVLEAIVARAGRPVSQPKVVPIIPPPPFRTEAQRPILP